MKRWWLVLVLMLSFGVNLGLLASRWTPKQKTLPDLDSSDVESGGTHSEEPGPSNRPLPRIFLRMANDLRLEGESRDRFLDLQQRFLRRTINARNQLKRSQLQLRRELLAAEPRRDVVRQQLDRMAEARGELETAFAENILDTREVLRPAQARRYLKMIQRLRRSSQQP